MHFDWIHAGALLLVILTLVVSLLGAALLWRDGYVRGWRASRSHPPICPKCKYVLSGLTHCRCPECGTEYRLDQLWRSAVIAQGDPAVTTGRSPQEDKRIQRISSTSALAAKGTGS